DLPLVPFHQQPERLLIALLAAADEGQVVDFHPAVSARGVGRENSARIQSARSGPVRAKGGSPPTLARTRPAGGLYCGECPPPTRLLAPGPQVSAAHDRPLPLRQAAPSGG